MKGKSSIHICLFSKAKVVLVKIALMFYKENCLPVVLVDGEVQAMLLVIVGDVEILSDQT